MRRSPRSARSRAEQRTTGVARQLLCARVVLCAIVLMVGVPGVPSAVHAATAPCDSDAERPAVRPAAPVAVAAGLQEPFRYTPGPDNRAQIVSDAAAVVRSQIAEIGADACYLDKPARIAERVDFLSPFEYLVVTVFDQEPDRRDALLDQYATDPHGAIKGLGEAFPSTRAQATLASFAHYDVNSNRIRVNAATVPPDQIRRVLVHEFWHAMPRARTWNEPDGRTIRASGFWLQEQRAGRRVWVPLEDERGLPFASYLLDEAMATRMETRYAGPSQFARHDVAQAQAFLDRLMRVAGPAAVMRDYLESRPHNLVALAEAHRSSFPELEVVGRP